MKSSTAGQGPGRQLEEQMMSRSYRGVVGPELSILQGSSVVTNLFLTDEEIPDLKCLLKFRAVVTNNEEFKYYNNCYDIAEQTVTITNGICRATRSTRPCVKVRITNPRPGTACLPTDSPVALVRIQLEAPPPAPTIPERAPPAAAPPAPTRKEFSAAGQLAKLARRAARRWDQLVGQGLWGRTLTVEERHPYFSSGKLKTPFGLKDKELNMRVGASQATKPVKVLDRVNGVFTCAICDVVVLDKYTCQDHWYSAQHKATMAQVQVIAGPEERLAMGRPAVTELLAQWTLGPLLGLDRLVEVLRGRREPYYHCLPCRRDLPLQDLGPHLAAPHHALAVLKHHFPAAWARFAPSPDPELWTEVDFTVLEQAVARIDSVHGAKRPGIAASADQLPEVLEALPAVPYSGKALDSFFRSLPPAEAPAPAPAHSPYRES
jgi:hypothetical protein